MVHTHLSVCFLFTLFFFFFLKSTQSPWEPNPANNWKGAEKILASNYLSLVNISQEFYFFFLINQLSMPTLRERRSSVSQTENEAKSFPHNP